MIDYIVVLEGTYCIMIYSYLDISGGVIAYHPGQAEGRDLSVTPLPTGSCIIPQLPIITNKREGLGRYVV